MTLSIWIYVDGYRSCRPILAVLIMQDVTMSILKQPWILFLSQMVTTNFDSLIDFVVQTDILAYKKHFYRMRYIISSVLDGSKPNSFPEYGHILKDTEGEDLKLNKTLKNREENIRKTVQMFMFKDLFGAVVGEDFDSIDSEEANNNWDKFTDALRVETKRYSRSGQSKGQHLMPYLKFKQRCRDHRIDDEMILKVGISISGNRQLDEEDALAKME